MPSAESKKEKPTPEPTDMEEMQKNAIKKQVLEHIEKIYGGFSDPDDKKILDEVIEDMTDEEKEAKPEDLLQNITKELRDKGATLESAEELVDDVLETEPVRSLEESENRIRRAEEGLKEYRDEVERTIKELESEFNLAEEDKEAVDNMPEEERLNLSNVRNIVEEAQSGRITNQVEENPGEGEKKLNEIGEVRDEIGLEKETDELREKLLEKQEEDAGEIMKKAKVSENSPMGKVYETLASVVPGITNDPEVAKKYLLESPLAAIGNAVESKIAEVKEWTSDEAEEKTKKDGGEEEEHEVEKGWIKSGIEVFSNFLSSEDKEIGYVRKLEERHEAEEERLKEKEREAEKLTDRWLEDYTSPEELTDEEKTKAEAATEDWWDREAENVKLTEKEKKRLEEIDEDLEELKEKSPSEIAKIKENIVDKLQNFIIKGSDLEISEEELDKMNLEEASNEKLKEINDKLRSVTTKESGEDTDEEKEQGFMSKLRQNTKAKMAGIGASLLSIVGSPSETPTGEERKGEAKTTASETPGEDVEKESEEVTSLETEPETLEEPETMVFEEEEVDSPEETEEKVKKDTEPTPGVDKTKTEKKVVAKDLVTEEKKEGAASKMKEYIMNPSKKEFEWTEKYKENNELLKSIAKMALVAEIGADKNIFLESDFKRAIEEASEIENEEERDQLFINRMSNNINQLPETMNTDDVLSAANENVEEVMNKLKNN